MGPLGRQAKDAAARKTLVNPHEGEPELETARKIFEQKEYAAAEKEFKRIAKKYKDKPVEEDALFLKAESQFAEKRYPDAQDSYDELMKKYPSTRHLEQCTKRQFAIAQYWLNSPKPASEVELTAFTRDEKDLNLQAIPDAKMPFVFPLTPNLTDRSRPMFDTRGRALQALKSVYINDPTGPLADDALMLSATYHLRKQDYREANRDFATIREMYADSEHAPASYILGSYASQKSYQGARYDGKQLDEAKKLTQSAVRLYPDIPQRAKLEADLRKIKDEDAKRDWERVQFHMKRREKDAAAVICELMVAQSPESPYAGQARELLAKLGPQHSAGILKDQPRKSPTMIADKSAKDEEPREQAEEENVTEPREPGRVRLSDKIRELPATTDDEDVSKYR